MTTVSPLGSDGQCTGIPNSIGQWDFTACCLEHDAGGTDGQFLDCITDVTGGAWIAAILCILAVFLMKLLNPIYECGQRWGLWK